MAGELTDVGENLALDFLCGNTAVITGPLKVALMSVMGSDAAAGTEFVGGSYARQTATFSVSASGATANTNTLTFADCPALTLAGVAIFDSAGSPKRIWEMARVGGSTAVSAGSTVTIAIGDIDLGLN